MSAPSTAAPPAAGGSGPRRNTGTASIIVGASIMASRTLGLLRQALIAKFFGASVASDAFMQAFKIPNMLQNMFGEGALSAAFIPVYANLLARGEHEEAGRVAGGIAAILALVTALMVLVGVLLAPYLILIIAPGFHGEKRTLTIELTRILFPGAGIFVLSAWCLAVLNSHRKFLLSYTAPVLWNVAMIATLVWFGPREQGARLAGTLAWASVVGAALQVLVQLPSVFRAMPHLRLAFDWARSGVRRVLRNFGPVFVSRGVVQLSSVIDQVLASWLPNGVVTLLGFSQTLYNLPVSVFGMAISAAELPEMSSALGSEAERATFLRGRVDLGLARIAYFVVPSAIAFLALGDVIARVVFQHGRFTAVDTLFTWAILAGAGIGLLASTFGRLYSSTYYALHDTRTPLRFAMIRLTLTTILGYLLALPIPRLLGVDPRWGAAGLSLSAGLAGWVEFSLLRWRMNQRIGRTGVRSSLLARLWIAAVVGAAIGFGLKLAMAGHNRFFVGLVVLGTYGAIYLAGTYALGVREARTVLARVLRR